MLPSRKLAEIITFRSETKNRKPLLNRTSLPRMTPCRFPRAIPHAQFKRTAARLAHRKPNRNTIHGRRDQPIFLQSQAVSGQASSRCKKRFQGETRWAVRQQKIESTAAVALIHLESVVETARSVCSEATPTAWCGEMTGSLWPIECESCA